jgi:hypothetical protein
MVSSQSYYFHANNMKEKKQCCGSGMFIPDSGSRIPDPDCYPSRIPDPKRATKERGEEKLVVIPFYVATNFTKLKIILVLKCRRKKIGQFSKNYRNFYPKNCH